MHTMTLFPLGNADCCRIDLDSGSMLLIDFADTKDPHDDGDRRCNLADLLRADLKEKSRDYFDVVAFSHLDKDHITGSSDFFFLEHAAKYQGRGRIKINVMWVPAAVITEPSPDDDEARILQREARYRFRRAKGIRVFSRPERLEKWCERNGVDIHERLHLITNAGEVAPDFSLAKDQLEAFVHSPFAIRQDDNTLEDRNEDSLVLHLTFDVDGVRTNALMLADSTHDVLAQIVDITKSKENESRLEWDIVKLPHHCSYRSLGPEKGTTKTTPVPEVAWLYEDKGQNRAIAISTSKPIPLAGSADDKDPQPPHRQAARYYADVSGSLTGQFIVTMEHPSRRAPKPIVIEIGANKATVKKPAVTGAYVATSERTPRAG